MEWEMKIEEIMKQYKELFCQQKEEQANLEKISVESRQYRNIIQGLELERDALVGLFGVKKQYKQRVEQINKTIECKIKQQQECNERESDYRIKLGYIGQKVKGKSQDYLNNIIIVPGDEERFRQMTGLTVESVKLEGTDKGLLIIKRDVNCICGGSSLSKLGQNYEANHSIEELIEKKVIGLLCNSRMDNYLSNGTYGTEIKHYGIPVRRLS